MFQAFVVGDFAASYKIFRSMKKELTVCIHRFFIGIGNCGLFFLLQTVSIASAPPVIVAVNSMASDTVGGSGVPPPEGWGLRGIRLDIDLELESVIEEDNFEGTFGRKPNTVFVLVVACKRGKVVKDEGDGQRSRSRWVLLWGEANLGLKSTLCISSRTLGAT